MPTSVEFSQEFPAGPDRVWAMLSDPEYVRTKGLRSGSSEVDAQVTEGSDDIVIISRRRMPAKIPSYAKKFVGEEIVLTETQTWAPVAADGTRRAEFVADFNGQPMSYSGTVELTGSGDSTVITTRGTVKASVPFVGGKIEGMAREWTQKYLRKEEEVAAEWLADHPA